MPAIETYRTNAGAYPASLLWYQDWEGYPTFQRPVADAAVAAGAVPQLTWQPRYTAGGNQTDFALTKIADGAHDSYLKSFADVVPSWGKRLYIRFAQEMIGDWYHGVLVCTATLPLTMSPLGVTSTRSSPRGGHQREVGVEPKL